MNDQRMIIRAPALAAAIVVALLLLAGAYTVAAGPAPATAAVPPPDLPNAAMFWTSGWTPINQNQTLDFNHNLGVPPEQLGVELWFKDTDDGWGINRRNYGGLEANGNWHGAYWRNLTANTIQVYRMVNDTAADQVNVKVWVVPPPDYDSGWTTINQGQTLTFHHNLGVTPTELTVSLWFSGTNRGIHHFSYGGLTFDNTYLRGASWSNLTNNTVQVIRRDGDADVEQVRVVVVHGDPPAYDSLVALGGWQNIAAGTAITFTHNLNWNPDMLLVRGECYHSGGLGIHQEFAGGDHFSGGFRGAHLQNLTANTIQFVRRLNDDHCPQARVVIYKRSLSLYLPLVLNNYTAP